MALSDNTHLAEEYFESLWERCEDVHDNGRQELGILPVPSGGFLVLSRSPGEWTAWLMTTAGDCKPAKTGHLKRILESL